jgi:hypothetical protein
MPGPIRSSCSKLTHFGFAKESTRDDHRQGWGRVLGWLQRYLATR